MKKLLLSLALAATLLFLAGIFTAESHSILWYISVALALAAEALIICSYNLRKNHAVQDSDPDGTRFTTQLNEMTDTISRATAERSCGIDTQILYEQARFIEPCADVTVRTVEHDILQKIAEMRPTDSDSEITAQCEEIMLLLRKRDTISAKIKKISQNS